MRLSVSFTWPTGSTDCVVFAPPALRSTSISLTRPRAPLLLRLEHIAGSASPIARDARHVQSRCRLGLPLAEALAAWPAEHDAPGVRAAAGALAVASAMGGRAADAIEGLASSLRHRLDAMAEARSLSTQARLSAIVVGAAPLGYLAFASLVDASAVDALITTGVGRVCLVVGVGLESAAAIWIRRIVTSEAR